MKIRYRLRGLNPRSVGDRFLARRLALLDRLLPISTAQVLLEHQRNTTPAFSVSVDLTVSGPGIHAAARDHTLEAAVLKVTRRLEEKIRDRKTLQPVRIKRRFVRKPPHQTPH